MRKGNGERVGTGTRAREKQEYPQEVKDKTLLLKTQHTLVAGHSETKSILAKKYPPLMARSANQAGREERVLNSLIIHPLYL